MLELEGKDARNVEEVHRIDSRGQHMHGGLRPPGLAAEMDFSFNTMDRSEEILWLST